MKISKAQFDDLQEEYGDDIRTYSGRGMYGAECLGYTGTDLGRLLGQLAYLRMEDKGNVDGDDMVNAFDFSEQINDFWVSMVQDSMGLGQIYYWPSVQVNNWTLEGGE